MINSPCLRVELVDVRQNGGKANYPARFKACNRLEYGDVSGRGSQIQLYSERFVTGSTYYPIRAARIL